jgi:hypothetical protein
VRKPRDDLESSLGETVVGKFMSKFKVCGGVGKFGAAVVAHEYAGRRFSVGAWA